MTSKNCDNRQKMTKYSKHIDINDGWCYNQDNLINDAFNVDELKKPAVSVGFFVFYIQSVKWKIYQKQKSVYR